MKKVYLLYIFVFFILPIFSIHAQSVDLLWQGDTYTPPFYKGKSLWSNQSRIILMAIPNNLGNSTGLFYKWTRNGTVIGSINGVGKNSFIFTDSVISRPQTIKVEILPPDESRILASASILIAPRSPYLTVYENNPLYGFMFHREMSGTYKLEGREVTFAAFPLFFSTSNRTDSNMGYQWGNSAGSAETQNSVTYRSPDDVGGTARVDVRATNSSKILQSGSKNFLVKFGDSE